MKQFKKFAAAALLLASSAFANAAIISYDLTDFSPAGVVEVKKNNPFTYTFDFNGDFDFIKGSDTINAAWLNVELSDNGGSETFSFLLDSKTFVEDKNFTATRSYINLPLTTSLLSTLNKNGSLAFSIGTTAGDGSFNVVSSSLHVQVEREIANPAEVPEPMSVALLGLGLAGIASARRRKA